MASRGYKVLPKKLTTSDIIPNTTISPKFPFIGQVRYKTHNLQTFSVSFKLPTGVIPQNFSQTNLQLFFFTFYSYRRSPDPTYHN